MSEQRQPPHRAAPQGRDSDGDGVDVDRRLGTPRCRPRVEGRYRGGRGSFTCPRVTWNFCKTLRTPQTLLSRGEPEQLRIRIRTGLAQIKINWFLYLFFLILFFFFHGHPCYPLLILQAGKFMVDQREGKNFILQTFQNRISLFRISSFKQIRLISVGTSGRSGWKSQRGTELVWHYEKLFSTVNLLSGYEYPGCIESQVNQTLANRVSKNGMLRLTAPDGLFHQSECTYIPTE